MSGILVIRPKGLGDIVHIIPSFRMLRENLPKKRIALLCMKGFGAIIPEDLNIEIIEFKPNKGGISDIKNTLRLIKYIRNQGFEEVYDLFGNMRTAIISFFSGTDKRFGFNYRFRKYAYKKVYVAENPNTHLMQHFGDFFAHFGHEGKLEYPNLVPLEESRTRALAALEHFPYKRPLLGLNPNSTNQSRAWLQEYIVEFIKLWYEKTGCPVMLTCGGAEEVKRAQGIINKVGADKAFYHKALGLVDFFALLSQLDLFVTGDTGPAHFAWAVNTPTVALYGPTTRESVAPRGAQHLSLYADWVECLQCHLDYCSHKTCMKELKPAWVLEKILEKYNLKDTRGGHE